MEVSLKLKVELTYDPAIPLLRIYPEKTIIQKDTWRRPSRWQRIKTWRSPCSPQIHQKYIYMWNNSYRTPTERWQKTSDFPKDIFFSFFPFCECVCVCFSVWICLYSFAFTICPRVLSVLFVCFVFLV